MKNQQSGFTLIELVAVIVILSILAVTALPKFADLSGAAKQAAVDAVAGNIASAMALNYGTALAEAAGVTVATAHTAVADCATAAAALLVGGLPAGYVVTDDGTFTVGVLGDVTETCTVTANAKTATFKAIQAP